MCIHIDLHLLSVVDQIALEGATPIRDDGRARHSDLGLDVTKEFGQLFNSAIGELERLGNLRGLDSGQIRKLGAEKLLVGDRIQNIVASLKFRLKPPQLVDFLDISLDGHIIVHKDSVRSAQDYPIQEILDNIL